MIGKSITVPAISVKHLSVATRNWLHSAAVPDAHVDPIELPFLVAWHDNGFFMTVPLEHHWQETTLPDDLVTLAKAFHEDGYPPFGWILVDNDGDVVPGLPTHD